MVALDRLGRQIRRTSSSGGMQQRVRGLTRAFAAPTDILLMDEPFSAPNAFPSRAAALKFPAANGAELTPVLVTVPASAMTFVTSEDKTSYQAEFTILVRLRNASNQVVDKMSQSYVLTGPINRLDSVKQTNVLFYRERELKPGMYTMEAIVHDATSDKASARFVTIEESQLDPAALRASDLVLISGAERVAKADQRPSNPFQAGNAAVSESRRAAQEEHNAGAGVLLHGVSTRKIRSCRPRCKSLQNGAQLATLPLIIYPRSASGRVQQVSRLPVGSLAAGAYDLRVVLSDGRQQIARSTPFRIVD